MTRPSPQTDRVVALVELLAERPEQEFTLADLTRRLGVHKQTCHSMLASLTEAGWLVRHPTTKTYRLGPKLIRAGRAATAGVPIVEYAHATMHRLAHDLDVHCLLVEREHNLVVIIDAASPLGRPLAPLAIGQSFPVRAPFGGMFAAWGDDAAFDAWTEGVPDDEVESFRAAAQLARSWGYEVRLDQPIDVADLQRRLGASGEAVVEQVRQMLGRVDQVQAPLDPTERYPVMLVSAPIDDTHALSLSYRNGARLSGDEVRAAGEAVRTAAAAIGRQAGRSR